MINLTDLKNFDLKNFDLKNFDLKNFDLKNFDLKQLDPTKIDLSRFDIRKVELPDLPKFELPKFDAPVDVDRVTAFARDAAYVGVGAVVVTAQKVDERRREMTEQVTTQIRKIVDAVA